MAGKQVNFEVNVDSSDGIRGLKDFSRAAQKAGKDAAKGLEDTASAGDKARVAIKAMAEAFDTQLRDAAAAAEALGKALGPELASRMDLDQVVADLDKMGVSFDEVQADADKFATTLREVDAITLARKELTVTADTSQVESGVARVKGDLDGLPASAKKGRNAMANLWGNAAQDLGSFVGISGSAGVALGQLAEGAADAANDGEKLSSVLGGIGKSLGPMLAITAATLLAQKAIEAFSGKNEEAAENIRKATEALQQGIGTFDDWASAVDEAFGAGTANTMEVFGTQILSMLDSMDPAKAENLQKALGFLGQDVSALGKIVTGGQDGFETWAESQLIAAGASEAHAAAIAGSMDDFENMLDIVNQTEPALAGYATVLHTVGTQLEDIPTEEAARNFLAVQRSVEGQNEIVAESVRLATDARTGQVDWNRALENYIDLQQQAKRAVRESVDAAIAYGEATQENTDRIAEYTAGLIPMATSLDGINQAMSEHGRIAQLTAGSWKTLIADIKDGHITTEEARQSWIFLQDQLNLTNEQMAELVDTKVQAQLEADAAAANELAAALIGVQGELDSAAGRADAFTEATERWDAIHPPEITAAVEVQGAIDDLDAVVDAYQQWVDAVGETDFGAVDVVPDSWDEIQGLPDDLPPVLDALAAFRESMQSEMAQAFEREGPQGLRDWATKMEAGVREALSNVEGITDTQVEAILHSLGLLPSDIETTIRISQAEQVLNVIDDVVSGLGDIPPQVSANIAMAVNNGDPDEALRILNEHLASIGQEPVTITINAETGEFEVQMTDATTGRTAPVAVESNADEVSGDIDEATEDRTTQVIVPKSDSLGQMQDLIDHVARDRTVNFLVKADNAGAIDAILDSVARPGGRARDADINVIIHGGVEAEQRLDQIAENRTAHITVQTHNTGGGGGGGAVEQSAPVPALLGAPTTTTTSSISAVTQTPVTTAPAFSPTINISAGVLGNHFDVERTVSRALRRYQRINGRRN